jgi:hypothetical protein
MKIYTILISDRQQKILHMAIQEYISARIDHVHELEDESALEDLLNPKGSTGPLVSQPGINSFVL